MSRTNKEREKAVSTRETSFSSPALEPKRWCVPDSDSVSSKRVHIFVLDALDNSLSKTSEMD